MAYVKGIITNRNIIITCAVTGSADTTAKHAAIPVTPEQIANASIEAAKAGAAVAHIHVRNPETGEGARDPHLYREVVERMPDHRHEPKVVGSAKAHEILPWVHRVFANLKTWALGLGLCHGLRKAHLPRYLDEFVFRWNRRRHTRAAFDSLLGIGTRLAPATYRDFVDQNV